MQIYFFVKRNWYVQSVVGDRKIKIEIQSFEFQHFNKLYVLNFANYIFNLKSAGCLHKQNHLTPKMLPR